MDETRTWRHTRPFQKPFSADRKGRPVRVSIWYPAAANARAKPMRVVDYLDRAAPEAFREANGFLQSRDRRVAAEMAPPQAFESLLKMPMRSHLNGRVARGRFPLVLYSGGVNSFTLSNVFIAELLASHGFVVATVPSIGPSDQEPEQVFSRAEVEDTVRDLEVAWSLVRRLPFCDESRLGVFGHSLGGSVATLFALRNHNVSAVAGLESTYGFAGSGTGSLTESPAYQPERMRATLLDLHRGGTQLDLSAIDGFHFANRYCLTVPRALHGDFTSFVVFARAFKLPP
ncbi:MAG TPA: prolyl oligopeptidase family serine peptidase, partial [Fimbriimonadaceae bacterium]|nr:prolyl oligopeptidase family serine peptidase [Fimbriimonadaceae bacterium]